MFSSRAALLLATVVFLGGPSLVHAQATFGKPVGVDGPDEIGLTPPTRDDLFRVQSEQSLKERLREALPKVKKVDFPEDAPLPKSTGVEVAHALDLFAIPISSPVCYRPLYFEDKRTERFGQYVPCVQPFLSAGRFYRDVVILPCRLLLTPPWTYQCDNR